jgi:hypothetical protein
MNTERVWQTALSRLRDAKVSVYPALVGATVSLNGDSVLRVTLAGADCLEEIEAYGVEKLSGYLSREIGGIERVEFRARAQTSPPESTTEAPEETGEACANSAQPRVSCAESAQASKAGNVVTPADIRRSISARLLAIGKRGTAEVFNYLEGQIYTSDGWTRETTQTEIARELVDLAEALAPSQSLNIETVRSMVNRVIPQLKQAGLILAESEPDEYGRVSYQIYGSHYQPRRAKSAQGLCEVCTPSPGGCANSAHLLSLEDVVDDLLWLREFRRQQHQQNPDSEGVQIPHTGCANSAQAPREGVQILHTDPEADNRRELLKAFGVTSPKALDDITAATGERGLDWLVGWMIEYQHRWVSNTEDGKKRWTKDQVVGQFVVQVRDHGDDPPEGPLKMARSRLDDAEEGGGFIVDTLREMLDGVSPLTFSEWW